VRVRLCGIGILPMMQGLEAHATVGSSAQIQSNPYCSPFSAQRKPFLGFELPVTRCLWLGEELPMNPPARIYGSFRPGGPGTWNPAAAAAAHEVVSMVGRIGASVVSRKQQLKEADATTAAAGPTGFVETSTGKPVD